jgi:hypothetical protein
MAKIEIVQATGKSYCRGNSVGCLCKYPRKIPKGEKVMRIAIYSAGGGAVAFYCTVCMIPLLKDFKEVLDIV